MIYDFGVQEPYKSFLINGQKNIEGRLNKGKFKKLKEGDILLMDTGEKFEVVEKKMYKTFYELMEIEGLENVLPDKKDIQNGVESVYYKFYSKEKEKQFGVVGIKVKLLDK